MMLRLRRNSHEMRIEMMPLIDVVFLILTFFIYAMVLMVPIELLPVPLQRYVAGERAEPSPAATVTITLEGELFLNRDAISLDALLPELEALQAEQPDLALYLVMAAGEGTVDRGPILTALWDRLKNAGLEIKLVGQPMGSAADR